MCQVALRARRRRCGGVSTLLSPPEWYLRHALAANLSLFEALCLWLYYCGATEHEISIVLGRNRRGVGEALGRARGKLAATPLVLVDGGRMAVSELRAELAREARELLEAIRNESARRGGTPGGEEHLPRTRLVTADDLVDERLRRLLGREGLDSTSGDV